MIIQSRILKIRCKMKFIYVKICDYFEYFFLSVLTKKYNIAVTDLVRYVFKATNFGKKHLSVPQLFRKRYSATRT